MFFDSASILWSVFRFVVILLVIGWPSIRYVQRRTFGVMHHTFVRHDCKTTSFHLALLWLLNPEQREELSGLFRGIKQEVHFLSFHQTHPFVLRNIVREVLAPL